MKKRALILCLGLIFISSLLLYYLSFYNKNDIKSVLQTKDFLKLDKHIKKKSSENDINGHWVYLRDITHEFKEGIFEYDQYIKDDKGIYTNSFDVFQVKLIVSNNEIIYYDFSIQKSKKVKYDWMDDYSWENYFVLIEKFVNQKKYNTLKKSFKNIFHSELNEKELFSTNYIYGQNCGLAGIKSSERNQMDNFVNKKDKNSILNWLKSTNTEKQIFAVEGILKLKSSGIKLSNSEEEIIKYILNKKGTIKVCHGCVFSISEISKIKKFFNKEIEIL